MLEVKWKVYNDLLAGNSSGCFNPCYVGSKMERAMSKQQSIIAKRFNPCYVGSKMERKKPKTNKFRRQCFNPCYVGSKMERPEQVEMLRKKICFNPCYVGSKMERSSLSSGFLATFLFQSLLCWK